MNLGLNYAKNEKKNKSNQIIILDKTDIRSETKQSHTIWLVCVSGDSGKNALSIINSKAHENSIAVKLVKEISSSKTQFFDWNL